MQERRKLNLKVGDTIWQHETQQWRSTRGWKEYKITAETSRSWIFGPSYDQTKIPKNGDLSKLPYLAFSAEEVAERDWLCTHPHQICRKMQYMCYDALSLDQWKQIAVIIGYKEEEGKG